jgi:hypothetical protein
LSAGEVEVVKAATAETVVPTPRTTKQAEVAAAVAEAKLGVMERKHPYPVNRLPTPI